MINRNAESPLVRKAVSYPWTLFSNRSSTSVSWTMLTQTADRV